MTMRFVPGSNRREETAGATWRFLLPQLLVDHVLCVGSVSTGVVDDLRCVSGGLTILLPEAKSTAGVMEGGGLPGEGVRVARLKEGDAWPIPDRSVDLIRVGGEETLEWLERDTGAAGELRRVLRDTGSVYAELGRSSGTGWGGALAGVLGAPRMLRVVRSRRRGFAAALEGNPPGAGVLDGGGSSRMARGPGLRWFDRVAPGSAGRGCTAAVWDGAGVDDPASPPRYLCEIAEASGVSLAGHRWVFRASGEYRSRKLLFFLYAPGGERPSHVVKMVRDASLNPRLENEARALEWLAERGVGGRDVPRVAFSGRHGGLAVVGETALEGEPMRRRSNGSPDCPYATRAVEWLIDLSVRTASRDAAAGTGMASVLGTLLERFQEIYRLTPERHAFLAKQIALIRGSDGTLPLVFQHGDPGQWNVLVRPGGELAWLDWEAAETRGMPLWDLFYFLRSHCLWGMRRRRGWVEPGQRLIARVLHGRGASALRDAESIFLSDSPWNRLFVGATAAYCRRTGVDEEMIGPLFFTCWMHRALKEATRLEPETLGRGHYVRLLERCIDARQSLALRRVFSTPGRIPDAAA